MKILDAMKRAADNEQLKLKPLPKHIIATESEHLRQNYALLLAAMLNAQLSISETQTRLTCLLLDALELGDIRGALYEQARALDEETTVKAARLIRDAGLARHLLVDALVLLRLDTPLNDELAELISEFASFLDVDFEDLKTCSKGAAAILGLDSSRSVVAAKQWPGTFPFIGKPIAPKPAKKQRSAAAKPKTAVKPSTKKPPAKTWAFPTK